MASVIGYMLLCLVLASELFVPSSPHPHDDCYGKNENMRKLSGVVIGNSSLVLAGVAENTDCPVFYMDADMCDCAPVPSDAKYRLFLQGENDFFVFYKQGKGVIQAKNFGEKSQKLSDEDSVLAEAKPLLSGILSRGKDVFCYNDKSVFANDKGRCSCDDKSAFCDPKRVGVSSSVANVISCYEVRTEGKQLDIMHRNNKTTWKTFIVEEGFSQLQFWNKNWNATQLEDCQEICVTTTAPTTTVAIATTPSASSGSESSATGSSPTEPSSPADEEPEILTESTTESYPISSTNVAHAGSNNLATLLYSGLAVGIVLMIIGALTILAVQYRWIPGVYVDPRKVQLKPSRDQIFG